ncbi:hypothetical protein KP509_30G064900 [Ceratopteris richardii]|uniref:Uncharacterized protein n=1 Tax=Ceratopteris richardii TaxID=49495 RepID=A0A8T2R4Y5_CERRI|nr:hypothetical protein KP509_30G064900 [Ceratopteris richardii]KAH7290810.1 hypothetical protein KP509_30G064900 [Ceratopteris richardii]KAH7290811.1 hypothetical protein KP509_30G064900 [Ceratopteris richardii]
MALSSFSSGVNGMCLHSVHSGQNEGLCRIPMSLERVRFASPFLQHRHYGFCVNLQSSEKKSAHLNVMSGGDQASDEDSDGDEPSSTDEFFQANKDSIRKNLENIIGDDDGSFCGKDLAMLIRNKYGRSYDVQLIKKEFMGRQLLALNVMWKYREQRSFPLTEEEYLLRLDDVANNLRCWGAVSYVRNSLAKTKERPRIGKAVSIFIDLDESGGRANEWIYR